MADPVSTSTAQVIDRDTLAAMFTNLDTPTKLDAAVQIFVAGAPLRAAIAERVPEMNRNNLLRQVSNAVTAALQSL